MKILVYSDLHLEHSPFYPEPRGIERADVAVLAGDIHPDADGVVWVRESFADRPGGASLVNYVELSV